MTEELRRYNPDESEKTVIKSVDDMAVRLGFTPVNQEQEEGKRSFSLKREHSSQGPSEYFLQVQAGIDPETTTPFEKISLDAKWAHEDEKSEYSPLSSLIDPTDIAKVGELGFAKSALEQGGYQFLSDLIQQFMLEDNDDRDRNTPEQEKAKNLLKAIAAFQEKFPDFTNTDFSRDDNLFIFSEPNENKRAQFIRAYVSGNGFNAQIGEAPLKKKQDKTLSVDIKNKSKSVVNVPIVQSRIDAISQTWSFGQEQEAADVAEIVRNRIIVDESFLDQVVSVKAGDTYDSADFQTLRDLIKDHLRLEAFRNDRIKKLIGPIEGDSMNRVFLVRRPQSLSEEELKQLTLKRLDEQIQKGLVNLSLEQAQIEVQDASYIGRQIMQQQIVQIETQLALIMMDRFTIGTEIQKQD